ncbi:MAG TPA: tRNA guanosine(34) transglycosylase Tgt [Ktedonobacteraceae bacterium]|jgi:queuine tRNA-ribosyltransferase
MRADAYRPGHYLQLPHRRLRLPIFMPDATLGVVRSLDASDLLHSGIEGVVMNTFHLMQRPGSSTIQALGGLHKMSAWTGSIMTDSGGFQAYSLIQQNARVGSISNDGLTFRPEASERKFHLTPEKAVQLQVSYGADIVVCLDECTHVDAPFENQQRAVERTIEWARRCKREFEHLMQQKRLPEQQQPLLFAVVQGGGYPALRTRCAQALLEIGFDGFGYGGWPLDRQGNLLSEVIAYTRELIPRTFPLHALGVGHPDNIVACHALGYDLFDSALPTRDARNGRLYTRACVPTTSTVAYLYVGDKKYIKSDAPVEQDCDCLTCRTYSLGYLHHLFKINDSLFFRLTTLHNLRFIVRLIEGLRESSHGFTA